MNSQTKYSTRLAAEAKAKLHHYNALVDTYLRQPTATWWQIDDRMLQPATTLSAIEVDALCAYWDYRIAVKRFLNTTKIEE